MYRKYGDTWFDDQFAAPSLSSILIGDAQYRANEGNKVLYGFESKEWTIQANLDFHDDVVDLWFQMELKAGCEFYYKESRIEGLPLVAALEKAATVLDFLGIDTISWITSIPRREPGVF